ncbi:multiheme c-type cytochrome [Vibrio vulnificus]
MKDKTQKESGYLRGVSASLLIVLVTGMLNQLVLPPGKLSQLLSLVHLTVSITWIMCIIGYVFVHTKRTLGLRKRGGSLLGVMALLCVAILSVTGGYLAYYGALLTSKDVLDVHRIASYLLIASLVSHVIYHLMTCRDSLSNNRSQAYMAGIWQISVKGLVITFGVVASLLLVEKYFSDAKPNYGVEDYVFSYGDGKFAPSLATTTKDDFVAIHEIGNSAQCIACHTGIGEQWLASAHKHAADDPAYVRNVNLLENNKGIEATRYCEGCHAPTALLSGALTPGGAHGGVKGTLQNKEGVGCMSCHGINKIHSTRGVASYNFNRKSEYVFESTPGLERLSLLSLNLRPQQHRNELSPDIQRTAEFCSTCHSQFMDVSMNEWGWVKMQDEYLAWSKSKFNLGKDGRSNHSEQKNCQACHMPLIVTDDPAADSEGKVRSHYFLGANAALAKHFGHDEVYALTIDFLQQDKVAIYIEPPENQTSQETDLFVSLDAGAQRKPPVSFIRGKENQVKILVSNNGVGHNFPAGTIDLSEAWIEFKVLDAEKNEIFSSGHLLDGGEIESSATVYKEVAVDRFGKEVWRHDLFNMVGKSYVNVIPAGGIDAVDYKFQIPDWALSPIHLSATLKYRKFNPRYFNWVNEKETFLYNPIIDISRDTLVVKLVKDSKVSSGD